jgi:hypothetical protein
MRFRALVPAVALGAAALGGCRADTDLTNPNTQTVSSFWRTETDAAQGLTAAYNALNYLGTYLRWSVFYYDTRSDIGFSLSPWTDLANQSKFTFTSYDFPTVLDTWTDTYIGISRANLVTANVPQIANMSQAARDRIVGEAKFLRALHYFRLVTLWGGGVPLITEPVSAADLPGPAGEAALWAQMEKDLTEASAALPKARFNTAGGHAVAGSAQAMLGKVLLQQRKWAAAAAALAPVVGGQYGAYRLVPSYGELFTVRGNNTDEALFENQFGDPTTVSSAIYGSNIGRFVGPCGPSFCDARPTKWYFDQFFTDSTVDGRVDPRAQATFFWYQGPNTPVIGLTWGQRAAGADAPNYRDTTRIYWRKWTEYTLPNDPTVLTFDAPLNYKIVRYADVLLMYAEALNETGQTAQAAQYVNQVRARANMKPIAGALGQAAMREAILKERLLEFGLEGQRWNDMLRHNLFSATNLPTLVARDDEFRAFVPGKSERFPIPTAELNLNPSLQQNPGW